MDSRNSYNLERYKAAFSDYHKAAETFNQRILDTDQASRFSAADFSTLAYALDVKHTHFIECAKRCAGLI